LRAIPIGNDYLNAATVVAAFALAYYFRLSWRLALGATVVYALFYAGALALGAVYGANLVWIAAALFVVGWIGQLIGHYLEGARPALLDDLQFLLIGPLWEIAHAYRALGWPSDDPQRRPAG
jgi:uncharacterized membrane protein YGL010W